MSGFLPGRVEIKDSASVAMVGSLLAFAMVMQNDLKRWQQLIEPPVSRGRASTTT